ncbi:MAG: hypothetical protein ACI9OJ_005332 [Myxococcota bacterium]|jgi:hypothetical protein
MVSREDLESFLIRMDLEYDEVAEGMFLCRPKEEGQATTIVNHSPPVVLVRLKMMDLPENSENNSGLYRKLLEFNATDIVHGAYGIEDGELIISDTLELGTLDFPELQASLESLQLAASGHLETIRRLAFGEEV